MRHPADWRRCADGANRQNCHHERRPGADHGAAPCITDRRASFAVRGEWVADKLSLPTKRQTRREAGTQNLGASQGEVAGLPKGAFAMTSRSETAHSHTSIKHSNGLRSPERPQGYVLGGRKTTLLRECVFSAMVAR
jgi:hypothetical protein